MSLKNFFQNFFSKKLSNLPRCYSEYNNSIKNCGGEICKHRCICKLLTKKQIMDTIAYLEPISDEINGLTDIELKRLESSVNSNLEPIEDYMVYYAHSKKIYGTKREKQELVFLEKIFKKVICPNRDMGEKGRIQPYLDRVKKSKLVVVSEYRKHIGKGCFCEIKQAQVNNISVLVLRKDEKGFYFKSVQKMYHVDKNDWAVGYGAIL